MNTRSMFSKLAVVAATVSLFGGVALAQEEDDGAAPVELKTVVLKPTGGLKKRHLDRIDKAIEKSLQPPAVYTAWELRAGASQSTEVCAIDATCLSSEGQLSGADVVVAVVADYVKTDADLTFVVVSVAEQTELARTTVLVKKRDFAKTPGSKLMEFLASDEVQRRMELVRAAKAAAAAPPPPPPVPEPEAAPEPAPAPPEVAPEPVAEPVTETPTVSASAEDPVERKPLHIGISTGVLFSQLQSELGTSFSLKLDGGYAVWRNLSVYGSLAYTQPKVESDLADPRLEAGDYMTKTTQRELVASVGAMWRLFAPGARWNAYGGLAARMWLLETLTEGSSGGEAFLENDETSTRFGFGGTIGGELGLGPGAGFAEMDIGGSDLPHTITGDVATTALAVSLGYRLLL